LGEPLVPNDNTNKPTFSRVIAKNSNMQAPRNALLASSLLDPIWTPGLALRSIQMVEFDRAVGSPSKTVSSTKSPWKRASLCQSTTAQANAAEFSLFSHAIAAPDADTDQLFQLLPNHLRDNSREETAITLTPVKETSDAKDKSTAAVVGSTTSDNVWKSAPSATSSWVRTMVAPNKVETVTVDATVGKASQPTAKWDLLLSDDAERSSSPAFLFTNGCSSATEANYIPKTYPICFG
jgi:hypothetical protein